MANDVADFVGESEKWASTLSIVAKACVVLRLVVPRAFDTDSAGFSTGTGFIVDKSRGLILTNRHIVHPGPVVAQAVFRNREEIEVKPLFRDPVHDFGLFRFDPSQLSFMEPEELELAPSAATVGLEVRVVGNDSGERLSILSGTIARCDREAPNYGRGNYNDWNTHYIQAASGTKGGSSGSPVVDINGRVVGINAGSKHKSSSAYFLPLDRVQRALRELAAKAPKTPQEDWQDTKVQRGTLQAVFVFKGYDEARRLGLSRPTEASIRNETNEENTGLLQAETVVPGGPAEGKILEGDALIRIEGEVVTDFVTLESHIDYRVGANVTLDLERGGEHVREVVPVQDLDEISPSSFLQMGGGIIHALSHQQARGYNTHYGQVYVADSGHVLSGVPRHAVIYSLNHKKVANMTDFIDAVKDVKHNERVPLQFYSFNDRHRLKTTVMMQEYTWYAPPLLFERDDGKGIWRPRAIELGQEVVESMPQHRSRGNRDGECRVAHAREHAAKAMRPSDNWTPNNLASKLALLQVEVPPVSLADGVHARSFEGTGLIVRHASDVGLIVTDRNTVPVASCDVLVSFSAYPLELQAKVTYLHPIHNIAILEYNPSEMPQEAFDAIREASLKSTPELQEGDEVHLIGLSSSVRPISRTSRVTDAKHAIKIPPAEVPRFRATNEEVVELDHDFGPNFSGVLADLTDGSVRALYASFARQIKGDEREIVRGIHANLLSDALADVHSQRVEKRSHEPCAIKSLEVEFEPVLLSKAAQLGLSQAWINSIASLDPARKEALSVCGRIAGSPAASIISEGDFLLAVDGKVVTCFRDVERSVDFASADKSEVDVTLYRQGEELNLTVPLATVPCGGTLRLVHWGGAQLQETHRSIRELGFVPGTTSVFVSRWHQGSPAHAHGLFALYWVEALNGIPTPDLDTFLQVALTLQDRTYVRVETLHIHRKRKVLALKLDLLYWPTWELRRIDGEWQHNVYQQ